MLWGQAWGEGAVALWGQGEKETVLGGPGLSPLRRCWGPSRSLGHRGDKEQGVSGDSWGGGRRRLEGRRHLCQLTLTGIKQISLEGSEILFLGHGRI